MSEILLVEDSDIDAKHAEAALKSLGIKNPIRRLVDGGEAMRLLTALAEDPSAVPPSVMFLDIKLPWTTGFEILRWMRDQPMFRRSFKIVFSSLEDTATIKDAYHLGANTFLSKPIKIEDLRELIKTYPQHWLINGSGAQSTSHSTTTNIDRSAPN